ncbi:MAG: TonB-dependent receptor plug [Bacteroidetes bacterium]|nr:TonB-dependent receptor plug [Bacteroidota bacterium]
MLLIIAALSAHAQYSIQSKVVDVKTGNAMDRAGVRLLSPVDSVLITGQTTDSAGRFKLRDIKPGKYILKVTTVGYNDYNQNLTVANKDVLIGKISMQEDARMLEQVNVTGTAVQVVVKNDTIEYNAQAFKTSQNAVVEDMLKKMPGVEVSSEGKITVNGQEVKKVLVDGKKFFGDDIEMSTKNIPADMIDKVQVVDQKSEMAKLTGFEDNDTERVINLTLKRDRKQGVFGNVQAGAGTDVNPEFRYDAGAFLNIMNGETRSTITAGANNTNTARSGRGREGFGGRSSGITATQNLGYNLNTPVNTKLILGGDASFNHSDQLQTSESNRENYLQGLTYNNQSTSSSNRENYQGNVRLEAEWKPDSLNTVVFQPNMGYNRSFNASNSQYLYMTENDSTSWGKTNNSGNGTSVNGGLNIIYSRKFAKPGRTFTTRLSTNLSQSNNDGQNLSRKNTSDSTIIIDQRSENISNSYNMGLRMSFVEPLWKNQHFLETSVSLNSNFSNSTRNLFDKDQQGNYTVLDDVYSNEFKNTFYSEALELNYRFIQKSYNITLGMKAEPSQTYSTTIYGSDPGVELSNEVINFAPNARFQYNFGKRQFARFDYSGRTSQPTISQMQPVKNNTDLMNETVGNPTLNPQFQHNLRLMYSTYNSTKFSSFSFGLNGSVIKDDLTNNSIYDKTGKRYIQTVNSKETPYNLNSFAMFSTPFWKKFNFSNSASFGVRQQYGYTSKNVNTDLIDIDHLQLGDLSSTIRYNASNNISLSYTHNIFDISMRGGLSYSNSKNNFNTKPNETYDWISAVNLGIRPTNAITFNSDLNYTTQKGYSSFNLSQWLWNASLEVSAFKRKGVFSLKVYDILRQRQNVSQTVGDNYIQYSKTNSLPAYFLVGFTYKITKFKGATNQEMEDLQNMNRFGPDRRMNRQGRGDSNSYHGPGGTPPFMGGGGPPPEM